MFRVSNLRNGFLNFVGAAVKHDSAVPSICFLPNRTIVLKKYLKPKKKPPPFPYNTKYWSTFHRYINHMFDRFDENTKLIVVDGQISVGKHQIARKIADELGMKFMPDITTDVFYINPYGFDFRNLDYKLPEAVQSYDEKRFNLEPYHFRAAAFQASKLRIRFAHYFDALCHLMHTGQGVVLVRCPYSDHIFANAMAECGYISEPARFTYREIVRHTLLFLMRPHLVIYIGANIDATQKNIKKKNIHYMTNSKALTPTFLGWIDKLHQNYITEASIHSHTLAYDWSDGGDVDIVLEDIERLDFDKERHFTDQKFIDWNIEEGDMEELRYRYTTEKQEHMYYFDSPEVYEAPEMFTSANDYEVWENVFQSAPGNEYEQDFNPLYGDKVLFKNEHVRRWDPWF